MEGRPNPSIIEPQEVQGCASETSHVLYFPAKHSFCSEKFAARFSSGLILHTKGYQIQCDRMILFESTPGEIVICGLMFNELLHDSLWYDVYVFLNEVNWVNHGLRQACIDQFQIAAVAFFSFSLLSTNVKKLPEKSASTQTLFEKNQSHTQGS